MKKFVIFYSVIAICLGAVLFAFGIYLVRINLVKMLTDSLKNTGIVGLIFVLVLYIPIILIKIFFWGCIFYGILYIFSGIWALISFFKGNFIHLQKNLRIFQFINALILFLIIITDLVIIYAICNKMISGVSVPLIIFVTLTTASSVALEIAVEFAHKKLRQILMTEWHPQ